jgi:6-phosphogluconolactonase
LAESGVRIVTVADPAEQAARRVARAIERADGSSGSARLAVPGGSAAIALGRVRADLAPGVWNRVRLTWVDERCVPFAHPDSNRGSAHRAGLVDPNDPPAIELALFLDGERPDAALARVRDALSRDFGGGIDVALIGMGDDGHIASLFPGHAALSDRELVAVVHDSPKPPADRVTLTLPMLRTARATVLLAVGEAKRAAISRLAGCDAAMPAALLGDVVVVTDLEI